MINSMWGTALRHFLRQPRTFAILDPLREGDAQYDSWTYGGCRVLACALTEALGDHTPPGSVSLRVIATDACPCEHVVVRVETRESGVWYLDSDGACRERTLIQRFVRTHRRTGATLVDYDPSLLDLHEIQCPAAKKDALTSQLRSALRDGSSQLYLTLQVS